MLTAREIQRITQGKLLAGSPTLKAKGVSIDSRRIKKGNIFIAIKGGRFDGHDFIRRAVKNGAAAVVVSKKVSCPRRAAVIRVKDTVQALGQIAAGHRARFDIPVIAVTGSTGKTMTKEMVAAVLKKRFKVLKNTGTENNQFGVPLTLLKMTRSHQAAVLELGTNQPGDIRWLAKITDPTTAVFTNIGESHLQRLKTPSGVFREKIQLINYMRPGGLVFVNGDDRYLGRLPGRYKGHRVIRFGCGVKARYKASRITVRGNRSLHFKAGSHNIKINSSAVHHVHNALAAISCGAAFKIRYNDIIAALKAFSFRAGRQEIRKAGRIWVIDDTYNANPVSFKSAVRTLTGLSVKGKRIVVAADMLELGKRSAALHRSVGRVIGEAGIDVVLTMGRDARHIGAEAKQSNKNVLARHCKDIKEIERQLKLLCRYGDAVLVKGSRGMHMERVVAFLKDAKIK